MSVDVIIATNRPISNLLPVLESYKEQTYKDFTMIIVTEGESQQLVDMCNNLKIENVQIYSIPKGTSNASISRNYAMKHGTGDIILFSDDDMVLDPDFIWQHVKIHQDNEKAVVRGLRYQKKVDGSFYLPQWELEAMKHWTLEKKESAWMNFVTSNGSVSRKLMNEIGEFDPKFEWSGCEDTDLAYRLLQAGGVPIANEKAINYHLGIDDVQSKFEKRINNIKYLQTKYPNDASIKWFVRLTLRAIERKEINKLFLD